MDREWEGLVASWIFLPDVAERIGTADRQVRSMVRDRRLLAFRVGENNALAVPEDFLVPHQDKEGREEILRSLRGSLIQLADAGFNELESLRWLYTYEDLLESTPIEALRAGRVATVRRAAQGLAF